ncbi:MAG: hypothetical protein QXJ74_03030 [Nitrososphaera sp.]
MIVGSRRIILIGVIVAVVIVIVLYPLIVSVPPSELQKTEIRLYEVKALNNIEQSGMKDLQVVFTLTNPTNMTLTISRIDYELFADGVPLGEFRLSYEDIPVNGRPPLFPNSPVNLSSNIQPDYSDRQRILDKIAADATIKWKVEGTAQIETALTQATKEFTSEI